MSVTPANRLSREGLEQVVKNYYQHLYRFAYSLAGNPHEAADLTQETFLIYATKGTQLREVSRLKSWLFTTLYREFLRQKRRDRSVPLDSEGDGQDAALPTVDAGVVEAVDGAGAVEALERVDAVYRAPLALFYLEGLSYREIAEALEVPVGTVMSRLSRGKAQLKQALLEGSSEKKGVGR